jgi:hypothetical protein
VKVRDWKLDSAGHFRSLCNGRGLCYQFSYKQTPGQWTELTGEGDRSECKIHFIGTYLEGTKTGLALKQTMTAVLQAEFISVMSESAAGKDAIDGYFKFDKYEAAVKSMKKEIRVQKFGFDEEEEVVDRDGNAWKK